jgi:hypothetical protein
MQQQKQQKNIQQRQNNIQQQTITSTQNTNTSNLKEIEFAHNVIQKYNLNAESITNIDVKKKIYKVFMIKAAEDMLAHQISKGNIITNADGTYMMGNRLWVNKDILISDILSENKETLFKVSEEYVKIIKAHIKVNENNVLIAQKKENITANERKLIELRELQEKEKTHMKNLNNKMLETSYKQYNVISKQTDMIHTIKNDLTKNMLAVDSLGKSDVSIALNKQKLQQKNEEITTNLKLAHLDFIDGLKQRQEQIKMEEIKLAALKQEGEKNRQHAEELTDKLNSNTREIGESTRKAIQHIGLEKRQHEEEQTKKINDTRIEDAESSRKQKLSIAQQYNNIVVEQNEKDRQAQVNEFEKNRQQAQTIADKENSLQTQLHKEIISTNNTIRKEMNDNMNTIINNSNNIRQAIVDSLNKVNAQPIVQAQQNAQPRQQAQQKPRQMVIGKHGVVIAATIEEANHRLNEIANGVNKIVPPNPPIPPSCGSNNAVCGGSWIKPPIYTNAISRATGERVSIWQCSNGGHFCSSNGQVASNENVEFFDSYLLEPSNWFFVKKLFDNLK